MALVFASCSGSSGPELAQSDQDDFIASDGRQVSSPSIVVPYDDDIRATTEAVTASHGKDALPSVVAALERGYDFGQIRTAANDGGLAVNGRISDAGEAVRPHDRRVGLAELPDDPDGDGAASVKDTDKDPVRSSLHSFKQTDARTNVLSALANALASLDVQLRDLNDDPITDRVLPGDAVLGAILALGRSGYTLDQIVDSLVFGDGVQISGGCAVISPVGSVRPKGSFDSTCSGTARLLAAKAEDEADRQATIAEAATGQLEPATPTLKPTTPTLEWTTDVIVGENYEPFGVSSVRITRIEGTDEFAINWTLGTQSTGEYQGEGVRDVIICTSIQVISFDGTGTFDPDRPLPTITFDGTRMTTRQFLDGPCTAPPRTEVLASGESLQLTDGGIAGNLNGNSYLIPGPVPVPVE